ncbi:hypothetical protein GCM10011450_08380 [Advenella faeciporci]|uniref:Tripartite tricarboxylate transporter substrate binding protein n=1 Tax=Advenella faeciporci TaxID=797535 RepID=A0A918JKV0_9BURK|nr:tripartite tricarboxylate transporter substrate binding protein [Advenella faeciporci]GGW80951.1 hypothetical protein GCM10011450_08380 [Advenella faeciporci]
MKTQTLMIKNGMAAVLLATAIFGGQALAAYPEKPVTIIINYPAGGALDLATRALATNLGKQFNQPIVIENRPGASGIIGAENVSRQKPDGYTMLATIDSLLTVNPYIYKNTKFDPAKSLDLVGLMGTFNQVLMVNKASKIKDIKGLAALAKDRDLNYSSAGPGTPGHLTMESFRLATNLNMLNIPFNGNAPAMNALLGNQVDAGFLVMGGSTLQHIQAGTLVPIATSGKTRESKLPDIPTVAESGLPGLENFDMQFAFFLMSPKGLDPAIAEKWNQALGKAMQSDEVKAQFETLTIQLVNGSQEEAQRWIEEYGSKMRQVITDADVKVE